MKAKILNPLQENMAVVASHAIDLLAQNANAACYTAIKDWFTDTVLMYALTVASGNDTYLKSCERSFDTHITPLCENKSHCDHISCFLSNMTTLLNP